MIDGMIESNLRTVAVILAYRPPVHLEASRCQSIVSSLEDRLGHSVVWVDIGSGRMSSPDSRNSSDEIVDSDDAYDRLKPHFDRIAIEGIERIVVLPFGLGQLSWSYLRDTVSWGMLQMWSDANHQSDAAFDGPFDLQSERESSPVCYFAESWSNRDWSDLLYGATDDLLASKLVPFLLVGEGVKSDTRVLGDGDLSSLGHWLVQSSIGTHTVRHAYLNRLLPDVDTVLQENAFQHADEICVVPWGLRLQNGLAQLQDRLDAGGWLMTDSFRVAAPTIVRRSGSGTVQVVDVLATPEAESIFIEKYHDALGRVPERIDASSDSGPWRYALWHLRTEQAALLPDEYRETLDEVSPTSMGSASLLYDEFGRVAWDKIWTSFCDLAMAGGPPHRGRLLEAVPSYDAAADLVNYQNVVAEIERGISLVTGLSVVQSAALGWVGVQCDSEAMAVWLLRAIIVENVMVRREGSVLYLPAGPSFTVKREIKNVITAVAKSVHYWRAHLRGRNRLVNH